VAEKSEADLQEIKNVEGAINAEVKAIEDDDIDGYLAVLSEDALFLAPGLPSMGGEELRASLREFLEEWRVEWLGFRHDETEVSGDLAFHRFSYSWRLEPKGGGQLRVAHGKGLHILRRCAGGNWKIAREVRNDRPTPITI
jgi:ketosteroid isomerase-like protein